MCKWCKGTFQQTSVKQKSSQKKSSLFKRPATIKIHPGFFIISFFVGLFFGRIYRKWRTHMYENNFPKLDRPSQLAQMKIKQLSLHNAHISNLKPTSIQIGENGTI